MECTGGRLALVVGVLAVVAACTSSDVATPTEAFGVECSSFAPDPEHPFFSTSESYRDRDMLDWERGEPGEVGLDGSVLEAAASDAALSSDLASLLVVREGKLAFERYFNGSSASEANNVHSLSKSILSLLAGIAIDDGALELDTEIGAVLSADLVGDHGDLTVRHLLTMSGGLDLPDPESNYEWEPSTRPGEPSFVRAVLERPSVAEAGTSFEYSTGLTQVLSAVVTEATGESLCEFAARRLFGPLGIDVERWWVEPGGYFAGGHDLFITPREVARLGQLVLQDGMWHGRQLVPTAWLDASLAQRWYLGCTQGNTLIAPRGYGYLWWRAEIAGHEVWNASGAEGQELVLVADLDLVLVITHANSGNRPPETVGVMRLLQQMLPERPDNVGRDACASERFETFTIRPDGTGRSAVRNWPDALSGSWAPDGSRLAVAMDGGALNSEIYTLTPEGTQPLRLTRDFATDLMPAWSPDGASIAFTRGTPSENDLYRIDSDGRGLTQLTALDGFEEAPTWSPDGAQIAFVHASASSQGYGASGQLWVSPSDGADPTLLLDQPVAYPSWAPDGRHIAFELRRDIALGEVSHIGVLDLDTGEVTDLGEGFVPRWSPDGTQLAYIAPSDSGEDIYVQDADGTNIVQLTDDGRFNTLPIWSPDGETIRFLSRGQATRPMRPDRSYGSRPTSW